MKQKMSRANAIEMLITEAMSSYDTETIKELYRSGFTGFKNYSDEELEKTMLEKYAMNIEIVETPENYILIDIPHGTVYQANWEPLKAVLPDAMDLFMFMGKIKLLDGTFVYCYKNSQTKKYINISVEDSDFVKDNDVVLIVQQNLTYRFWKYQSGYNAYEEIEEDEAIKNATI